MKITIKNFIGGKKNIEYLIILRIIYFGVRQNILQNSPKDIQFKLKFQDKYEDTFIPRGNN